VIRVDLVNEQSAIRQQAEPIQRRAIKKADAADVGARLEQPASTWTRISCSSTLESINFSAFNRSRLKAG
jgi:hypothetical protein